MHIIDYILASENGGRYQGKGKNMVWKSQCQWKTKLIYNCVATEIFICVKKYESFGLRSEEFKLTGIKPASIALMTMEMSASVICKSTSCQISSKEQFCSLERA